MVTSPFGLPLVLSIIIATHSEIQIAESGVVGVNYGTLGNNLPAPSDVVALYRKYGIISMRLFEPNSSALEALRESGIHVSLGVRNDDIPAIASTQSAADSWFATNVEPYLDNVIFTYITVGSEVIPGDIASFVAPAIENIQNTLHAYKDQNLTDLIQVTTVVPASVLGVSYPPSSGAFAAEAQGPMVEVLKVLSASGKPLMVNVYPYFAYASDPQNVRLDYAQFTAPGPVVRDGNLSYQNLLEASLDAFYSAMEKVGVSNVRLVVSESGWPSAGNGNFTTPNLAQTYNNNLIQWIIKAGGTPKRPDLGITDGFIFAMFNENEKPAGVEQHWGLFYPNMDPVYPVNWPN